jgi:prophage regulatory protein
MHKILRLPQVKTATGLGRSTIYKKMAEKTFPTNLSLGSRSVGWLQSDIDKWIENRISESKTLKG